MRAEVISSSFPRWERDLDTGESGVNSSRSEIARRTIVHSPKLPSRVTLTVAV